MIYLILFTILSGICEAAYFHIRQEGVTRFKYEHYYLTVLRATVFIPFGLTYGWLLMGSAVLIFPFLHDGVYYTVRNIMRPGTYTKHFFDYSTQSTAIFTLTFPVRLILALVGLLIPYIYDSIL